MAAAVAVVAAAASGSVSKTTHIRIIVSFR